MRTWHLQLAIFWIATAYVGGALFVAGMLGRNEPAGQRPAIHLLFGAIVFVAVGSLLGEWAGIAQLLGKAWFWFGNQGWEYLELGRAWQILLAIGLVFWFVLLWRNVAPAWGDSERRGLISFFLIAAAAIPVFYLPALFYDGSTHFTIVDTWRFWIIHLWVEGFFELFVTVIVAIIFYELGLVERDTALRVIYLDLILVFGGGLIGTGHHWYFNGQTEFISHSGNHVESPYTTTQEQLRYFLGGKRSGELDGHRFRLSVSLDDVVMEGRGWCIVVPEAPSASPEISITDRRINLNPIWKKASARRLSPQPKSGLSRFVLVSLPTGPDDPLCRTLTVTWAHLVPPQSQ